MAGVRVPALYLTVDDLEGFAAALAKLGLPGADTRRLPRLPPPAMPDPAQDDALAHAADRDSQGIFRATGSIVA